MPQPSRRTGRRPRLEHLEDRTLLAAGQAGPLLDLSGLRVDSTCSSPSHILVQFLPNDPPAALAGTTLGPLIDPTARLYQVDLLPGTTVQQAVRRYAADPGVAAAEPDYRIDSSWLPNDPLLGHQWDMHNTGQQGGTPGADINAGAAWGVTTGTLRTVVAVIDTGIDYTHPDLYQNLWINQAEIPPGRRANLKDVDGDGLITFRDLNNPVNQGAGKITDLNHNGYIDAGDILAPMVKNAQGQDTGRGGWSDGIDHDHDGYANDLVGWNFAANTNTPTDDWGHGTHVAGAIGAMGNNGRGVSGVLWNVQMMDLRFFDAQGHATIGSAIAAIDYAVGHGARILNASWIGAGNSSLLQAAIARAGAKGAIFVAAAGNSGVNTDVTPEYPADFPLDNVVSVAAVDHNNHLAGFSNWGPTSVDVAAPGANTYSTLPGGGYGYYTGTSMATPLVTGALALVWGLRPEWSYRQVINQVLGTVDKLPSLQGKVASGGVLDVGAAIRVPPRTVTTASVASAAQPIRSGAAGALLATASLGEAGKALRGRPNLVLFAAAWVAVPGRRSPAPSAPPARFAPADEAFLGGLPLGRRRGERQTGYDGVDESAGA
jgi:subtilisin family serine protease